VVAVRRADGVSLILVMMHHDSGSTISVHVIWVPGMPIPKRLFIPEITVWNWEQIGRTSQWMHDAKALASLAEEGAICFESRQAQVQGHLYNEILMRALKDRALETLIIFEGATWAQIDEKVVHDVLGSDPDAEPPAQGWCELVDGKIGATIILRKELNEIGLISPHSETPLAPYWSLWMTSEDGEASSNQVKLANHGHYWHPFGTQFADSDVSGSMGVPIHWQPGYKIVQGPKLESAVES